MIEREPDWSLLPASTPPAIKSLIERCLVKSPRQRLQAIGDARLVLEETLANLQRPLSADASAAVAPAPVATESARGRRRRWLAIVPWVLAAAALAWAIAASLRPRARRRPVEPPLTVEIVVGTDDLYNELGASFALSPDGSTLAYVESGGSERSLFVRPLDQLEPTPARARRGAIERPLPSVRLARRQLDRLRAAQRAAQGAGLRRRAAHDLQGRAQPRRHLARRRHHRVHSGSRAAVSSACPRRAASRSRSPRSTRSAARSTHRWPQALPDGKHVLFTSHTHAADLRQRHPGGGRRSTTGERKVVYRGGSYGRYVPTGHLVFVNRGTLFAVPFDLDSLETSGAPVPVLQKVATSPGEGGAQFDFSATGRLVYGSQDARDHRLSDRLGRSRRPCEPAARGARALRQPAALARRHAARPDRAARRELGHLGLRPRARRVDAAHLRRGRRDRADLVARRAVPDLQLRPRRARTASTASAPTARARSSASPSREFAQWASVVVARRALRLVHRGPDAVRPRLSRPRDRRDEAVPEHTEFGEGFSDISPDGRFLAYASNESGTYQVYVRPFPSGEGKWQVSDAPGTSPRWRADGRELFWRNDDGIVAAAVETDGPTFRAGKPQQLFTRPLPGRPQRHRRQRSHLRRLRRHARRQALRDVPGRRGRNAEAIIST